MRYLKLFIFAVITGLILGAAFTLGAYGETENGVIVDDVTTGETDENGQPYLIVLGYRGDKNSIDIPSVVEGQTVKYISKSAFASNKEITRVVIPGTVIDIGDEVFSYCINLRTVVLPETLTKINISAFRGCTLLSDITLPSALTEIDDFAFEDCSMLKNLKIPASVTLIGYNAFMACENLVLDCTDNSYALIYAGENRIVTDAADSPDYPLWTVFKITLALGAAVIGINFAVKLIIRRKKKRSITK